MNEDMIKRLRAINKIALLMESGFIIGVSGFTDPLMLTLEKELVRRVGEVALIFSMSSEAKH